MILNGKMLANKIKQQLKEDVEALKNSYTDIPKLAIVWIGNNPASEIYIKNKIKTAASVGIEAKLYKKDENIQMQELITLIDELNNDKSVNGIIVQLPLPKHLDENIVINHIKEEKDVDGFGLVNKGMLLSGLKSLRPATPHGVMKLLSEYNIDLTGLNALVIGRSNIVGKPLALMFLEKNATVTVAHSKTKNLKELTRGADLIAVAIGKPNYITADMVKEGAIIVDIGINRVDGKVCGDVDYEEVSKKASFITPVPGGVGPLTIVTLLTNTYEAFIKQHNKE